MNTDIKQMVLYAWVGEDERGSGEIGIKQGLVPAGYIPIVACKKSKVDQAYIIQQLQVQASVYGKRITLCSFVFEKQLMVLDP